MLPDGLRRILKNQLSLILEVLHRREGVNLRRRQYLPKVETMRERLQTSETP